MGDEIIPLVMSYGFGGDIMTIDGIKILRMRIRDFNNGIQNGYLKSDISTNKKTTLAIIESLESNKKLWNELMTTYKLKADKTNNNVIIDIDALITTLSELHMTKADKVKAIKAKHQQQIELLQQQMNDALNNL